MKKIKYLLLVLACMGLNACGVFHKGCGCPHFGKTNLTVTPESGIA